MIAPVNAPLLMAEQRTLDEAFGKSGAIQLDEGPIAPVARVVNRAREQLLARSGFSFEQDGGASRRRRRDGLQEATDLDALTDDRALVAELHDFAPQRIVLAAQAHDLECLRNGQLELFRADGLGDVIHRAGLDRRHRLLDRGVTGEHDQRDIVAFLLQELEELEPRQPGHAKVRDDQVDVSLRERLQRLGHIVRADGGMAGPLESVLEDETDGGLIVHIQDGGHLTGVRRAITGRGEEYCRDAPM